MTHNVEIVFYEKNCIIFNAIQNFTQIKLLIIRGHASPKKFWLKLLFEQQLHLLL